MIYAAALIAFALGVYYGLVIRRFQAETLIDEIDRLEAANRVATMIDESEVIPFENLPRRA